MKNYTIYLGDERKLPLHITDENTIAIGTIGVRIYTTTGDVLYPWTAISRIESWDAK